MEEEKGVGKEEYDLTLADGAAGAAVRNHLVMLQNLFSRLNEIHDDALRQHELYKIMIDEVEEKVNEAIVKDYPVTKGSKKKKLNIKVSMDELGEISLLEARKLHVEAKYNLSKAKSKLTELKTAINSTRSVLAWDKQEYEETKG